MNSTSLWSIREPRSNQELTEYFELRYKVLYMPLGHNPDAAKDRYDSSGQQWYLAAYRRSHLVGVGRLRITKKGHFIADMLAVDPNQRLQGVGRMLMHRLEQLAQHHGASKVEITARHNTRPFFRKLGYVEIGEAPALENLSQLKINTRQTYMQKEL